VMVQALQPGDLTPTPSPTSLPPTPTLPSPTPSCHFPTGWQAIIVNRGDDLESLADTYQTSPEALMEGNCLLVTSLSPGSQLYVPEPVASLTPTRTPTPPPTATRCAVPPVGWIQVTIHSGDSLYSISLAYGITVSQLQAANCMGNSTLILAGETLWVPNIPTRTPMYSPTPYPSATPKPTATLWPTGSATPTGTMTATATYSATPTFTATATPSEYPTATSTNTSTATPEPTATSTATSDPYPYP
jgi:LysM repeat protein